MAGSFQHVLTSDRQYRGTDLLENMGDMQEAVDEMAFMLLAIEQAEAAKERLCVEDARLIYYACMRGEKPWPEWFIPQGWPRE